MPDNEHASGTGHKEVAMTTDQGPYPAQYPVQFAVEYPDRPLNRLTSFFRIFVIIPIAILFTGRYPRGIFSFVEGVFGCTNLTPATRCVLYTISRQPLRR